MALINEIDAEYLPTCEQDKLKKNRFENAFEALETIVNKLNEEKFIKKGELVNFFKENGNTLLFAGELIEKDARLIINK